MFHWSIALFLVLSLVLFLASAIRSGKKEKREGRLSPEQFSGFCLWKAVDSWGNYVLYPIVLSIWGIINGTIIMVIVTLAMNIVYIITNNATETDWTLMSWFTYLRDSDSVTWPLRYARLLHKRIRRVTIGILALIRKTMRIKIGKWKLSNPMGFVYLSIFRDSFYAINFLYHKKVDLRKPSVLGLFLFSHLICNLAWVPIASLLSVGFKIVARYFVG